MKDKYILKLISKEIEGKYDCKVVSIDFVQLLSPCIRCKIKFNEDFLYKPFEDIRGIDTILFSERTISFCRRVDLFDCVQKLSNQN